MWVRARTTYVYRTKESVENVLIKSFKFLHKRGLTFQKSLYTLCVNSVEARSGVQFIILNANICSQFFGHSLSPKTHTQNIDIGFKSESTCKKVSN